MFVSHPKISLLYYLSITDSICFNIKMQQKEPFTFLYYVDLGDNKIGHIFIN
jgi:hypothetical protein